MARSITLTMSVATIVILVMVAAMMLKMATRLIKDLVLFVVCCRCWLLCVSSSASRISLSISCASPQRGAENLNGDGCGGRALENKQGKGQTTINLH